MKTELKDSIIRNFPSLLDLDYAANKIVLADGWYNLLLLLEPVTTNIFT